ncbi:MAG TPA: hypothetical protein PKN91_09030 [Steroidobacteraceae bacterium]|nr:hypothetical protein [Steroidobacteraceae bacterium]
MKKEQRQQRIHPAGMGGTQRLYRFPNEYGASVVQSPFSYGGGEGLFELAVTAYFGEGMDDFELTYSTPITNDVIGYLTEEEVQSTLDQIRALPQERT